MTETADPDLRILRNVLRKSTPDEEQRILGSVLPFIRSRLASASPCSTASPSDTKIIQDLKKDRIHPRVKRATHEAFSQYYAEDKDRCVHFIQAQA